MKRIFIMIMCLISLNLSAQEVMYFDLGYSSSLSDIEDIMNELKLPNTYIAQLNSAVEDSLNNARQRVEEFL